MIHILHHYIATVKCPIKIVMMVDFLILLQLYMIGVMI